MQPIALEEQPVSRSSSGTSIGPKLGEESETALATIRDLFHLVFDGVEEGNIELLTGLYLVSRTSIPLPPLTGTASLPLLSLTYMRLASASYGWRMVMPLLKQNTAENMAKVIQKQAEAANRYCLHLHCGVLLSDVLVECWDTSEAFLPSHLLIAHHRTREIILVIRGTLSAHDVLTDLVGHAEPFKDGFAHSGILKSARKLQTLLKERLREALQAFPTYSFVITGHSLGAGTAVILSLLLKEDFPEVPTYVFAFASPPVVSQGISESCKDYVHTYVYDKDIVPRASLLSLQELLAKVRVKLAEFKRENNNAIKSFFGFRTVPAPAPSPSPASTVTPASGLYPSLSGSSGLDASYPSDTLLAAEPSLTPADAQRIRVSTSQPETERLCVAGTIYYIRIPPKTYESARSIFSSVFSPSRPPYVGDVVPCDSPLLSQIPLSSKNLDDHRPVSYELCVEGLCPDTLAQEQQQASLSSSSSSSSSSSFNPIESLRTSMSKMRVPIHPSISNIVPAMAAATTAAFALTNKPKK